MPAMPSPQGLETTICTRLAAESLKGSRRAGRSAPGVIYIRDRSNAVLVNYSSAELALSLRRERAALSRNKITLSRQGKGQGQALGVISHFSPVALRL